MCLCLVTLYYSCLHYTEEEDEDIFFTAAAAAQAIIIRHGPFRDDGSQKSTDRTRDIKRTDSIYQAIRAPLQRTVVG